MCCIAKIVSFKINNYGYCNNAFLGKDQILVGFDYYGYIDDPLRIVVMVSTGIGIRGVISVVRVAFDSFLELFSSLYRAMLNKKFEDGAGGLPVELSIYLSGLY